MAIVLSLHMRTNRLLLQGCSTEFMQLVHTACACNPCLHPALGTALGPAGTHLPVLTALSIAACVVSAASDSFSAPVDVAGPVSRRRPPILSMLCSDPWPTSGSAAPAVIMLPTVVALTTLINSTTRTRKLCVSYSPVKGPREVHCCCYISACRVCVCGSAR